MLALNGGTPNNISYNTIPRDQISARLSYYLPSSTSGAYFIIIHKLNTIVKGEPICVYAYSFSFDKYRANPKSAILIIPLCNNILASLRSLCNTPCLTSVLNALSIYKK